jgi:hypothetical protein
MDWAWGKEAQFQSDVLPQVGLDAKSPQQLLHKTGCKDYTLPYVLFYVSSKITCIISPEENRLYVCSCHDLISNSKKFELYRHPKNILPGQVVTVWS